MPEISEQLPLLLIGAIADIVLVLMVVLLLMVAPRQASQELRRNTRMVLSAGILIALTALSAAYFQATTTWTLEMIWIPAGILISTFLLALYTETKKTA